MNARATRRPHSRRVRSKPTRRVGKASSDGCAVIVFAMVALPIIIVALVAR